MVFSNSCKILTVVTPRNPAEVSGKLRIFHELFICNNEEALGEQAYCCFNYLFIYVYTEVTREVPYLYIFSRRSLINQPVLGFKIGLSFKLGGGCCFFLVGSFRFSSVEILHFDDEGRVENTLLTSSDNSPESGLPF